MQTEDFGDKKFVGHTGGTLAFSAELRMNVEDGYIVVVLSNIPVNQMHYKCNHEYSLYRTNP